MQDESMTDGAIQDHYPDELAHCYGCGRLNPRGLRVRSFWRDGETVAHFTPRPEHIAIPGTVYGGLIASLIDCHGTGTAAAAACQGLQCEAGSGPVPRFVTASLTVDYVRPTPLGPELTLTGRPVEIAGRKVIVDVELTANAELCARGRIVAVRLPDDFLAGGIEP